MPLPALIPEAVVVIGIAVESDVEPVLEGGIPFVLLYVPKRPEVPADVVEHAVKYHLDAVPVKLGADVGKIPVGSETAVDHTVIGGIIAVPGGFKHRSEIDGVRAQSSDVTDKGNEIPYFAGGL